VDVLSPWGFDRGGDEIRKGDSGELLDQSGASLGSKDPIALRR